MSLATAATTLADIRQRIFHFKVLTYKGAVLQYRAASATSDHGLCSWGWPSTTDARVTPEELEGYRASHQMLGPCCFCPLLDQTLPDFVESAMYRATAGKFAGKYVATCARGNCEYVAPLEDLYNRPGTQIAVYPLRQAGERAPPYPRHISEEQVLIRRPLKRTYAMLDINADTHIPLLPAPKRRKAPAEVLKQLDTSGITASTFESLFAKCGCGLILTWRAFGNHECIIDLTD